MKTNDREYRCIYNHGDGYPSHLGKVLLQHYKDKDRVKSLIEKGSFSSIQDDGIVLEKDLYNEPAVITKDPEKFIKDRWGEYMYLYDTDTRWHFKKCGYNQTEWIEMTADSINAYEEDED